MAQNVIRQETEGAGLTSGSQSPETPSLPVRNIFGREFRLICPICLQDLKRPRQLMNCYHIFCSNCIQPTIENATDGLVRCPLDTCKKTIEKQEVSDALDSDTYIHSFQGQVMMYAESGSLRCGLPSHDSVSALYYCLECKLNVCDGCYGDHNGNEEFKGHHCLRLYQWPAIMTVGMNRASARSAGAAAMGDGLDAGLTFKCPIERNTDKCEHEQWLNDLRDEQFLNNDQCPIPEHAPEKLIAFCIVCQEPICSKCSTIEHRDHKPAPINISRAKEEKLVELKMLKKELNFKREIFNEAYQTADKVVDSFEHHINQTEQEMIRRKANVLMKVEESFRLAYGLIDQTGQKQAELSRQSEEMLEEANFLKLATELAEKMSDKATPQLAVVRAWKGLDRILKDLHGQTEKGKSSSAEPPEDTLPQCIVEKRLVLPAPNCMTPDLRILRKVGVEGTVLRKSFHVLPADDELLLFYSILPLTATEALVSCKTESLTSSVVQYSSIDQDHHSVQLPDGQYSIVAVPGNGIVATLYNATHRNVKREVLFWDQALNRSLKDHEAQNAGNNLKPFATTELPPRGLAVTRDNHLVICTAEDPPKKEGEPSGGNCIVLMTMRGDEIRRKVMASGPAPNNQYFPRYVTVNINDDVCVTDDKQQAIHILSRNLDPINIIKNPYDSDSLNKNFCPMGICHDSFGRLIVADSNNHCILRLVVEEVAGSQQVEVILKDKQDGVKDLSYPTLVALGPGPRLWVVCRSNIHVFDYMDEERAA